jgi:hypothetical protein
MPRAHAIRKNAAPRRRKQGHRFRLKSFVPGARLRRRAYRAFLRAPASLQAFTILGVLLGLSFTVNWVYQVARKPSELFFPVSGTLNKMPAETWQSYEPMFRRNSTAVMTPELLAALAQVEGSGNPVARTYWRWSFTRDPANVYRPASSAVGVYQITDGTFAEARRYCIRDHVVVEDGPWNDAHSCWLNGLYTRVVPAHAVELTSAYLDRAVTTILARHRLTRASLRQKQALATLVHLCGAGAGEAYARRGLRLLPGQRCGDHDARAYLARVNAMKSLFAKMGTVPN